MVMAHYTSFLVSLLALFSIGHADVGFDYLMLSLEWPPSFCETMTCDFPSSKVSGWNVHGLWPSNFNKKYPEYCHGTPFDSDKLAPIRSVLQLNWADLLDFDSPDDFWSNEWKKHGECCANDSLINTEIKYFNTTVQLKLAINLTSAMSKSGITPSSDDTYQISDIEAALRKIYGFTVNIRCVESDGDAYWVETRFCFDTQLTPIDCPEESISRMRMLRNLKTNECSDEVRYPPFDSERQRLVMRWKRLQQASRGFDHL